MEVWRYGGMEVVRYGGMEVGEGLIQKLNVWSQNKHQFYSNHSFTSSSHDLAGLPVRDMILQLGFLYGQLAG